MSLTSIIDRDKELRHKIGNAFLRPKLERNRPLLAEPLTEHYGLVGTAFDYIFRFFLEKINNAKTSSKGWIAEQAIWWRIQDEEKREIGSEIISNVKELKKEFVETGKLSRELIRQTLRMSYIDSVYRSGKGFEYIGKDADQADIEDIEKQFSLVDEELFRSKDVCLLNPSFGEASNLVGGADADFLLDDKLIDIKTTKKLQLGLDDFCQVIGYLLLHRIGGIEKSKEIEINHLGIYYSRYGYLFLFDVQGVIDDGSLRVFTEWFENRIRM